jgi:hypothetical protein
MKKAARSRTKKKTAKKAMKTTMKKTSSRQPSKAGVRHEKSSAFDKLLETRGTVPEELAAVRFAGVSLAGGKTDKTAVAILEYYPDRKRVFLRSLRERVPPQGELSADQVLQQILTEEERELRSIAFDAPLSLPTCISCRLKCPGFEKCREPQVKWMHEAHKKRDKTKRPNKHFTPYTERCVEIHISNDLEEPFHPSHALGANAAPLTARAQYLKRLISTPIIEVFPKLTLWRIGQALRIQNSHLRFHKHAVDSDEARLFILKTLIEKDIAFIYQQDLRLMVENNQAFEAFLCALTGFLKFRGQTERPPTGFPKGEAWVEFPKEKIQWF